MIKLICEVAYENVSLFMPDGTEISSPDILIELGSCCASGDVENACSWFNRNYDIDWRTVRKIADDPVQFKNVQASKQEITAAAKSIYPDSETDFTDQDNAQMYLIWQSASDIIENQD